MNKNKDRTQPAGRRDPPHLDENRGGRRRRGSRGIRCSSAFEAQSGKDPCGDARPVKAPGQGNIVETAAGRCAASPRTASGVQGHPVRGVDRGEQRFMAPVKPKPWTGRAQLDGAGALQSAGLQLHVDWPPRWLEQR